MNKLKNVLIAGIVVLTLFAPTITYAVPSAPPGENSSSTITYVGSTTITSDTTESEKTYSSTNGGKMHY